MTRGTCVLAATLLAGLALPDVVGGQTVPSDVDALASRGVAPAGTPVPGRPSVIVVHGRNPDPEHFTTLIQQLETAGYNVYIYAYQLGMMPAASVGPFTAANLETYVRSVDDLPEASAGLADAALYLAGQTGESTINLIGFSLGGVVARGASVVFPDRPDAHTLASNDPKAPKVNLITVDSPLNGMAGVTTVGAFFAGLLPNFYGAFSDSNSWYLNGRAGANVHHELGSSAEDEVVTLEGQQLPNGLQPDSRFELTGTHVGAISTPENVARIVATLTAMNARRVSMAPSSPPAGRASAQLFAFGGATHPDFMGAVGSACDVVAGRYAAAAYTSSSCGGSSDAIGVVVGGGISVPLGPPHLAVEAAASFADLGDLALTTSGARTAGNLQFDLASTTSIRFATLSVGPAFRFIPVTVTPLVRVVRWASSETLDDSLRAGTPQVQVRGGQDVTRRSDLAIGGGVQVRVTLAGPLQLFGAYYQTRLQDLFPAGGSAGWPQNVTIRQLEVGGVLAFSPWR